MTRTLLCLGFGYTAQALARRLQPQGWTILGTYRDASSKDSIIAAGAEPIAWDKPALEAALARATDVLISASPTEDGDPSLVQLRDAFAARAADLSWVGYLSTTGVYGDQGGDWVDETADLHPSTERGQRRVEAEREWQAIDGLPLHLFRLAGIYGPGRGPFAKVRAGTARRIIKPGQVFSRIHVEDIAQCLEASLKAPAPGEAYNVCDDDPAPPQDVIEYAATLLGVPVPPDLPIDEAKMSPMARSFYSESKRVSNRKMKEQLGVELIYPDYRTGLQMLLEQEQASGVV
jgi:nucleoside-diphosphate-sugar epimerase